MVSGEENRLNVPGLNISRTPNWTCEERLSNRRMRVLIFTDGVLIEFRTLVDRRTRLFYRNRLVLSREAAVLLQDALLRSAREMLARDLRQAKQMAEAA